MPVTNYDTVNGKIRTKWTGERPGSQAVFHDPLGSVVGIYEDGWLKADRVYDASGETRAEWNDVGTFGWVGGHGYRETRREWVSHYVRARHYSYMTGGWTSVDPLWPSEMAYGYVAGRVLSSFDFSGTDILPSGSSWQPAPIPPAKMGPCSQAMNKYIFDYCNWCYKGGGSLFNPSCELSCDLMAKRYYSDCKEPGRVFPPTTRFRPPQGGGQVVPGPVPRNHWLYPEEPAFCAPPQPSIGVPPRRSSQDCHNEGVREMIDKHRQLGEPVSPPGVVPFAYLEGCLHCCEVAMNPESCATDCKRMYREIVKNWAIWNSPGRIDRPAPVLPPRIR